MEEYIADLMSYEQLQKKVLANEQKISIMTPDDDNTLGVVVPDMGSYGGNPPYVPGQAGLVNLYNRSSGLELDSHGRLIISRASNEEVIAGVSNNNPIVPATILLALQSHSFKGDISNATSAEENIPPSAKAVKDFVENHTPAGGTIEIFKGDIAMANGEHAEAHNPPAAYVVREYGDYLKKLIMPNLLDFNEAILPKKSGDTVSEFLIPPGMFAIVVPYGGTNLKFFNGDGNVVKDKNDNEVHGFTILYSTDKGFESWDTLAEYNRVFLMWLNGINSDYHHNVGKKEWKVQNHSTAGNAYVFYISRKGGSY